MWAYDFDAEAGTISNKREFIKFEPSEGAPDRMTVDAEGCLWIAMWDGWCIQRISPQEERLSKIHLPVQKPTSCTLGGKNLDELLITSASSYLNTKEFAAGTSAGALLSIQTVAKGGTSGQINIHR